MLLACTLTFVVPKGQFRFAPGDVPHPPVQLIFTNEHRLGSANPSCAAVRLAPSAVLPLTVSCPAFNTGNVACADAIASARPAPTVRSGAVADNGNAPFSSRFRNRTRAVAASVPLLAGAVATRADAALSRRGLPPVTSDIAAWRAELASLLARDVSSGQRVLTS